MTGKINAIKGDFPGQGEILIYIIFEDTLKKDENLQILDKKTAGKLSQKLELYDFKGKEDQRVVFEFDSFYKALIILGAGKSREFDLTKWRNLLANAFRKSAQMHYTSVTICYFGLLGKDYFEIGKNAALALYLSNYNFDFYKSEEEKKKTKKVASLDFLIGPDFTASVKHEILEEGIIYGKLLSEGIYLTRDLVNQPGSHTHPETLVQEAFKIEKSSAGKIKVEVLDEDECRRLGMGAFLGVAQGSDKKPKFIILHYNMPGKKKIGLIGKSITFDSGGLSLKPSQSMETMKMDMAGGATVLGIFKILADSNVKKINSDIYGILPACENMPSGRALRPGDIVTTANKKSVEVLNTDAEGRLALADAISYAEKYLKPDIIIDIATLTGACMVALGTDITGLFGNDKKSTSLFSEIAKKVGEELWQLPLYKPYAKMLKSDIADLKNISSGRYGGAITAALFLAEFVKSAKWIHLDIAGPAFNEGNIHDVISKGATGWGVLTITEFLDKYVT